MTNAPVTVRAQWKGPIPASCDLCNAPIIEEFIDGVTQMGPWGNMCPACHKAHGKGLGPGRGQHYKSLTSNVWEKIAG